MTVMQFSATDIPQDEAPDVEEVPNITTADFDPAYPGSTPEAPYGFKEDGTPYKRRPRGTASGSRPATGTQRMAATETQARSAANMLARMNALMGLSLGIMGMPLTQEALANANDAFAEQAYQALLLDPALCRKILSAGGTSGKAGLVMAYVMLGGSLVPAAVTEIRAHRALNETDNGEEYVNG